MDPWASTNQGLANLTSTLGTLAQFKRQDRLDAEQAHDHAKARTLADLQLKTEQQKFDDKAALRTELANVQGKYLYPEPQGVGPMQPENAQTLSDLGPVQQPANTIDRMKVASNLASQGNTAAQAALPQMAQVIDLDDKMAKYQAEVEAGGGDRQAFLKQKQSFERGKEMIKTLATMMANPSLRPMAEKQLALYKMQEPDNPDLQSMGVDDFALKDNQLTAARKDPATGRVIGYMIYDPLTDKSTFEKVEAKDVKREIKAIPSKDGKTEQLYSINTADPTDMLPIKEPYAVKSQVPNVNVNTDSGGAPVAQSTYVDGTSGKPLVFDKKTGAYRVATVEGADVAPKPAAMSPEAAGKAQMVEQAITYIPTLRQELFDADGSVNRTIVANMVARTPYTRGRELSTLLLDAVEAKLRVESGAAVPDAEVKRAAKRFVPSPMDSADNVKIKMDNLEKFLKGTTDKINTGRGGKEKQLDATTAQKYLRQAGGNKDKARELARKAGYSF
jgi:hypothetical protein